MLKTISIAAILTLGAFSFACGGGAPAGNKTNANTNANSAGTGVVQTDPANMPAGLSTSPVPPSANSTPGIPAVNTVLPKGATPTPGIPSPEEIKKGVKPGLTPTPGIPSPAELKKAMSGQPSTAGPPPPAGTDAPMMMKSTKKTPKPQ